MCQLLHYCSFKFVLCSVTERNDKPNRTRAPTYLSTDKMILHNIHSIKYIFTNYEVRKRIVNCCWQEINFSGALSSFNYFRCGNVDQINLSSYSFICQKPTKKYVMPKRVQRTVPVCVRARGTACVFPQLLKIIISIIFALLFRTIR